MNIESLIHQALRPIYTRFSQIIARGCVTTMDKETLQIEFQKEDVQEGIERIEPFGFYSNPGEDSEALILFPDGYRSSGVAIALTQKTLKKPTLPSGAASMVAADGTAVTVEDGGKISIKNGQDELISILVQLIDSINSLCIMIPTVQANLPCPTGAAAGPITIPKGSIDPSSQSDLKKIQKRLNTFQNGVT
jgi:phage gp45-like